MHIREFPNSDISKTTGFPIRKVVGRVSRRVMFTYSPSSRRFKRIRDEIDLKSGSSASVEDSKVRKFGSVPINL